MKAPSLGTEEVRAAIRKACLEDLYFFAKAVMAYGLPEKQNLLGAVHREACQFLQQRTCPRHPTGCTRKFLALPRGHLKTTLGTKAYPIWRYLHNANLKILLANEKAENAQKFLGEIKAQFERNALFRWLFPEALPDVKTTTWTTSEILLPRTARWSENTIETIGVGGSKVSEHYHLIIVDDPIGLDDVYSAEVLAKKVEWFKLLFGLLVPPQEEHEILLIGNRWAVNDIGGHVLEHCPEYDVLIRPIMSDGVPLWPEANTVQAIEKLMEDLGPKLFAAQCMNAPIHGNPAAFETEWVRRYVLLPQGLHRVLVCDPAIGEKASSDYTAIMTLGMDKDRNIYVVDQTIERYGVDELCEEYIRQFMAHRPSVCGLETIFFQKVLQWPLKEAMRRYGVSFSITPLKVPTSKDGKIQLIAAMQPYFARGQVFWPRGGTERLEQEYRHFPDPTVHDDGLNAMAFGIQLLTAPTGHRIPEESPLSYESLRREVVAHGREMAEAPGPWTYHAVAGRR